MSYTESSFMDATFLIQKSHMCHIKINSSKQAFADENLFPCLLKNQKNKLKSCSFWLTSGIRLY